MSESEHATSASFIKAPDTQSTSSICSAQDKGKAPLVDMCPPAQAKHHYVLPAAEYSSCYPHNAPSVMDLLITNIHEISEGPTWDIPNLESPNLNHLARFMDFLSKWAHTTSPPLPTHGSRPFQIYPPSESFHLGHNPSLPSPPNQDFAKGPGPLSYGLLTSQIVHYDKPIDSSPNPFQIISQTPPSGTGSFKPNRHISPNPSKLTCFHPYYTRSRNPFAPPSSIVHSPPPPSPPPSPIITSLPSTQKRPWIDLDELPLSELKKLKTSKPTKMEMAALSLTALQYSMDACARSNGSIPPSIKVPPVHAKLTAGPVIHSLYDVPPSSMEVDMEASLSPIRKYYHSTRGTRLFNQDLHRKTPDMADQESTTEEKGENQSGSPPQQ
jgi:hypothetical protein